MYIYNILKGYDTLERLRDVTPSDLEDIFDESQIDTIMLKIQKIKE